MNKQMPSQMTIKDYFEYTGLADSTIRRKIKAGLLQAHQVDGCRLINVDGSTRLSKRLVTITKRLGRSPPIREPVPPRSSRQTHPCLGNADPPKRRVHKATPSVAILFYRMSSLHLVAVLNP